jgi:hypothetical protein
MFTWTWKTYYVEKQRRTDEADLAQQSNFEGHIMLHNTARSTFSDRVLALLGAKLIAWGCRLQEHYADVTTAAPACSARTSAS